MVFSGALKFKHVAVGIVVLVAFAVFLVIVFQQERPRDLGSSPSVVEPTGGEDKAKSNRSIEIDLEETPSVAPPRMAEIHVEPLEEGAGARISIGFTDLQEVDLAESRHRSQHTLKEWKGRIAPRLPLSNRFVGTDEPFFLSLPTGEAVQVVFNIHEAYSSAKGVYSGTLLEETGGEVYLSYVNEAVAGGMQIPSKALAWEIRNAGSGMQYIALVDTNDLGECGICKLSSER